ncbi:hypothetical protein NQ317_009611 [Molorchus minor]|uniref:Uncharacterized protein n=1 Tax=Molorchus minor TaxID=1323400 RepID=A0ABQ9JTN3_9CUCU|nr:hypothetical protein NQ317_009611 [Molorchus minor]
MFAISKIQEQELLKQYEHDTDKKSRYYKKFMMQQKEELKSFRYEFDQQQILEQAEFLDFM